MDEERWAVIGILVFILLFGVALWLGVYYDVKGEIREFEACREVLESARANPAISPYELAAIQTKVSEWNEWLASIQYRRGLVFGFFLPGEIDGLEPIR